MLAATDDQRRPGRDTSPVSDKIRASAGSSTTVLLVEDSDGDAGLVEELLADEAPEIMLRRVALLHEAERILRPDTFELILLDLGLPDGVGLDVVERIRRVAGNTPIVVLTGRGDDRLARQCLEHGAQDFVRKSDLDGHVLLRAIEHSRARERARDLERKLESADRLATLGQLAANVAHEVNNPATFIQLNSHELLSNIDALLGQRSIEEPLHGVLHEMRVLLEENLTGINRIVALVRDLQAHTNNAVRTVTTADINALCRSTCSLASRHLTHRARLRFDLSPVPILDLDPGRLGQVLMNLVVNASQAVGEGNTENEVCVATQYRDGWLEVNVSDTGVGIAPEDRTRIFEPFFTTKPAEKGTGLGLSICRDLVEAMGGSITVTSGPVRGSVFSVRVPAQRASAPQPTESPILKSTRKRVLLVDDDRHILRPLTRALSPFHDVTPAGGGHEALRKVARQEFDVVICDLVMPEMDGVQLIEELCKRHPEYTSRVVVLSGGATTVRTATFLEESGIPQLSKPTSVYQLRAMIEAVTNPATAPEASQH